MIVSYGIQTHPARAVGAARVLEQLGRPADVHVDTELRGPWNSARKVWQATPASCDWRCLLQDDIDLAPDFAAVLEDLLELCATGIAGRPLALYNGLTRYGNATTPARDLPRSDHAWIERVDGVQGPVIVLPARSVAPMLEWCEIFVRDSPAMTSSDIRPSLWLEAMGKSALAPVPSWVQHRGHEPSLNGTKSTKSQPRTAPTYLTSSLTFTDWSKGLRGERLAVHGLTDGASRRVRWHLWRSWQTEPDHVLESYGMDPRNGMQKAARIAAK